MVKIMYKILYLPTAEEVTNQRFSNKEAAREWIKWVYQSYHSSSKAHLLEIVEV